MIDKTEKYSLVITILAGAGLCVSSLIPADTLESGAENPLPRILLILGGSLFLKVLLYSIFKFTSWRRLRTIRETWIDAPAEILSAETGKSHHNSQPFLRLTLKVLSSVHGEYTVKLSQLVKKEDIQRYFQGKVITVKENPEKSGKVHFSPEDQTGGMKPL